MNIFKNKISVFKVDGKFLLFNQELNTSKVLSSRSYKLYKTFNERSLQSRLSEKNQSLFIKLITKNLLPLKNAKINISEEKSRFDISNLKVIYVGVTDRCNLNCIYCYNDQGQDRVDLDFSTFSSLISDLKATTKAREIVFTGGESLLHPDIYKMGAHAKACGFKTGIISNGQLINDSNVEAIAENFDTITISLDSINEELNNLHRGTNSFQKTNRAIERLSRYKNKIRINSTISKLNLPHAQETFEHFYFNHPNFLQNVTFISELGKGSSCKNLRCNCEDKLFFDENIRNFKSSVSGPESLIDALKNDSRYSEFSKRITCSMANVEIYISPFGDVYPCRILQHKEYLLGNIKKKPLSDIYVNSPRSKLVRKFSVDKDTTCRNCDIRYICGGGCRSAHYNTTKSIFKTDKEYCKYAKKTILQNLSIKNGYIPKNNIKEV